MRIIYEFKNLLTLLKFFTVGGSTSLGGSYHVAYSSAYSPLLSNPASQPTCGRFGKYSPVAFY